MIINLFKKKAEKEELDFTIKNSYARPPMDTEKNKMTNLWMDVNHMFVPYIEYNNRVKISKKEIGRMFGCKVIMK